MQRETRIESIIPLPVGRDPNSFVWPFKGESRSLHLQVRVAIHGWVGVNECVKMSMYIGFAFEQTESDQSSEFRV